MFIKSHEVVLSTQHRMPTDKLEITTKNINENAFLLSRELHGQFK